MRTAVIGAGRMGRRHVQVVRELEYELVGVADIKTEALAELEKESNVSNQILFNNPSELLKTTHPECVIVSTTAPSHAEYTCLAAELGAKYILCEKPMAISLGECDRMIENCNKHGAFLAINHQMRYMEQYTAPKKIIDSTEFGALASVTVIAGNFGLAMNGSHYFEMFRFMTGEEPSEIAGWFSKEAVPNPRGKNFEDRAGSVRIVTKNGIRFYLETGADQGNGITVIYAGEYGQIVVDELAGEMQVVLREAKYRELPTTRYGMPSLRSRAVINPADAIAPTRCVMKALSNREDYPSGEIGRMTVATLAAAYISNDDGHRHVRLEEAYKNPSRTFPWA
jgi:predicted dehydrogenase